MREFRVPGTSPQRFVERVEREIQAHDFADIAAVGLNSDRLVVTFSWMGTSTLEYRLEGDGEGFVARLEKRRMSPFHAPFKAGFDERFEKVLHSVGAELL